MANHELSEFLADVVMTGYYLAEPTSRASCKLHDVEAKCLKIIHTAQPVRVIDLARLMHITKSRATQLVHSLEIQDLVKKDQSSDHREVILTVTTKGLKTISDLRQKYIKLADSIEMTIGQKDTEKLCQILRKIVPLNKIT